MGDKHSPQKIVVTITLGVVLLFGLAVSALAWRLHNDRAAQDGGMTVHRSSSPAADIRH